MEVSGTGATEHLSLSEMEAAEPSGVIGPLIPIVEVAFRNDQWWSIPKELSQGLVEKMREGQNAGYTWDWGENGRVGSWKHDEQETSINRYILDFVTMTQTNIDSRRKRSIRIVYVRPEDVEARFTGQISSTQ